MELHKFYEIRPKWSNKSWISNNKNIADKTPIRNAKLLPHSRQYWKRYINEIEKTPLLCKYVAHGPHTCTPIHTSCAANKLEQCFLSRHAPNVQRFYELRSYERVAIRAIRAIRFSIDCLSYKPTTNETNSCNWIL